jgi:hypothetical protein
MARHYIEVGGRRVEVEVLGDVHGGLHVEAVRAYPSAKGAVCKGQIFTVAHDLVIKVTSRQERNAKRSKAFKKKCKEWNQAAKATEGPESNSQSLSASTPSEASNLCPVCSQEHLTGSCTMTNVLEGK